MLFRSDGDGEIETNDLDYERNFIVTPSKGIKDRLEYTEGDTDIAMSEFDYDKLRDKYIRLSWEEVWAPLADWVQENEMYCTYYNDNPDIFLTGTMRIDTHKDDIKAYTKTYTKK